MSQIHRFSQLPGRLTVFSPSTGSVHDCKPSAMHLRGTWSLSCRLVGVGLCLSLMGGQAWGQIETEQKEGHEAIVAAGFGYQNSVESTITVKVYNPASGEVLSEDVYELSVKEDSFGGSNGSEGRIFAGGVGLGATDLSSFIVRVYDAKTGEFQWSGRLNLTPGDGSEAGRLISTVVPRRATIMKIHGIDTAAQSPLFVLRAVDVLTGGILWEDEFSADGEGAAKARQIATRLADAAEGSPVADLFDFRIRMFDHDGRTVLWEDQVLQQPADAEVQGAVDDRAQMLPAWTGTIEQDSMPEEI
ncbi:MAG: hypothetical protein K2Q17_17435 [Nitrospiraceae bacterium]|nr:hypothetical protein [Nitrospiraceae bacterium]